MNDRVNNNDTGLTDKVFEWVKNKLKSCGGAYGRVNQLTHKLWQTVVVCKVHNRVTYEKTSNLSSLHLKVSSIHLRFSFFYSLMMGFI